MSGYLRSTADLPGESRLPNSDFAGYLRHIAKHFSLPTLACQGCTIKLAHCALSRAWPSGIVAELLGTRVTPSAMNQTSEEPSGTEFFENCS